MSAAYIIAAAACALASFVNMAAGNSLTGLVFAAAAAVWVFTAVTA